MIPYIIAKLAPNSTDFTRGVGQIRPREGLFSCRPLPRRGQICDIPAPPPPIVHVFFSYRPSVSPVFRMASLTLVGFLALLRPPRSCPSPPAPGLYPSHDTTVSLGCGGIAAVVAGYSWRRPFSRVIRPTSSITSWVPGFSLPSTLLSDLVPVPRSRPPAIPFLPSPLPHPVPEARLSLR